MPCRDLPAFAQLEEDAELQATRLQRTQVAQVPTPQPAQQAEQPHNAEKTAIAHNKPERAAERKQPPAPARESVRVERDRHREKHEAKEHVKHPAHERRRRV